MAKKQTILITESNIKQIYSRLGAFFRSCEHCKQYKSTSPSGEAIGDVYPVHSNQANDLMLSADKPAIHLFASISVSIYPGERIYIDSNKIIIQKKNKELVTKTKGKTFGENCCYIIFERDYKYYRSVQVDGVKYRVLYNLLGTTLNKCVQKLIESDEKGVKAMIEFNGHSFYSDTVTLDSAYMEIQGKTYSEFVADQETALARWNKERAEDEALLPARIERLKKAGRELIHKELWEDWDKMVTVRAKDIYKGFEVDSSLKIIKVLTEDEDIESAVKVIRSQGHSGMSYSLVREIVRRFGVRGEEFAEACGK
ncbi:MAG: hypothetical protein K0R00_76 [Herbinix sp.]|jgi:hypothetical protein|nr:hypothetical protein [Herbinix sp.]